MGHNMNVCHLSESKQLINSDWWLLCEISEIARFLNYRNAM